MTHKICLGAFVLLIGGAWVACNNLSSQQESSPLSPVSPEQNVGSDTTSDDGQPELSLVDIESLMVAGEEIGAWLSDEIPAAAMAAATAQVVEAIQADPTLTLEEKLAIVKYANSFLRGALGDIEPDVQPDLRETIRLEIENSWGATIREESEAIRLEIRRGTGEPNRNQPEPEGMRGSLDSMLLFGETPAADPAAIQEYSEELLRSLRADAERPQQDGGDDCGALQTPRAPSHTRDDTCDMYDQCINDNRQDAHEFADAMTYALRQLAAAYCIPVESACRGPLRRTSGCRVARLLCNYARGAVRREYNSNYDDYLMGQCGSAPMGCI